MTTSAFREEALKVVSPHAAIALFVFDFGDGNILRYTDANAEVVSGGETYLPLDIEYRLPPSAEGYPQDLRLVCDNVDLALTQAVMETTDVPVVDISVVTTIDLDVVEFGPVRLKFKGCGNRSATKIEINVGLDDLLNHSALPVVYGPATTPGLITR